MVGGSEGREVDVLLYLPATVPGGRSNKRVIGIAGMPQKESKPLARSLTITVSLPIPDSTMSLFSPDDPYNTTRLFRFLREVNDKHRLTLETYQDLYQWSISNIDLFWSHVWDHTEIIGNKGNHIVDTTATPAKNPTWFSDSTLNFTENLLSNRSSDTTAIIQVGTVFIFPSHQLLGNELHVQSNPLPRIPSPSLSECPTHGSTRSLQTLFPHSSTSASSRVIVSRHTPPTAS